MHLSHLRYFLANRQMPTALNANLVSPGNADRRAEMSQRMAFVSPKTVIFTSFAFLTVFTPELTIYSRPWRSNVHD
jgi:hypothetical protein